MDNLALLFCFVFFFFLSFPVFCAVALSSFFRRKSLDFQDLACAYRRLIILCYKTNTAGLCSVTLIYLQLVKHVREITYISCPPVKNVFCLVLPHLNVWPSLNDVHVEWDTRRQFSNSSESFSPWFKRFIHMCDFVKLIKVKPFTCYMWCRHLTLVHKHWVDLILGSNYSKQSVIMHLDEAWLRQYEERFSTNELDCNIYFPSEYVLRMHHCNTWLWIIKLLKRATNTCFLYFPLCGWWSVWSGNCQAVTPTVLLLHYNLFV